MRQGRWWLTLAAVLALAGQARAKCGGEAAALPDASFAAVEHGANGEKIRRLPYRDAAGHVDAARVRAALRAWKRVKWADPEDAKPALAVLVKAKAQLCAEGKMKCGKPRSTAGKAARPKKTRKA